MPAHTHAHTHACTHAHAHMGKLYNELFSILRYHVVFSHISFNQINCLNINFGKSEIVHKYAFFLTFFYIYRIYSSVLSKKREGEKKKEFLLDFWLL